MPVLPAVLYGCDTWSLTLREEHRLGMYDKEFLGRRLCEIKRQEGGSLGKIT